MLELHTDGRLQDSIHATERTEVDIDDYADGIPGAGASLPDGAEAWLRAPWIAQARLAW